jgi:hypothetical protein
MAKAATATSFESILDTPAEEVSRPKAGPVGTYDVIVKGLPEHGQSSQKKTPFVKFTYAFVAAHDDVDETELAEWLTDKDGNQMPIGERTIRDTYYTTPDALWRLTDVLEHMGIDAEGKTIRQMLDETPNASLRILVSHRSSEDGESVFAEVKRTMAAD